MTNSSGRRPLRIGRGLMVLGTFAPLVAGCTSGTFAPSDTTQASAPLPTSPSLAPEETTAGSSVPSSTAPPATSVVSSGAPCHLRVEYGYALPDPACTPGAANPQVTQGNIGQTICSYGWTRTVRPPESYTEPLKRAQMSEYGETLSIRDYEEDHLIPLELGGAPSDPHNLWPEPGASPNPKDDVENAANRAVCDGAMSLASAQRQIASDWVGLGRQLWVITAPRNQ